MTFGCGVVEASYNEGSGSAAMGAPPHRILRSSRADRNHAENLNTSLSPSVQYGLSSSLFDPVVSSA